MAEFHGIFTDLSRGFQVATSWGMEGEAGDGNGGNFGTGHILFVEKGGRSYTWQR